MREIRRVLENEGGGWFSFPELADGGPGVRFVAGRPRVARQAVMTLHDGLHFAVEWQGREVTAFVASEVVQDLGRFTRSQPDTTCQKLFKDHRGKILEAAASALRSGRLDRHARVRLIAEDFPGLVPALNVTIR